MEIHDEHKDAKKGHERRVVTISTIKGFVLEHLQTIRSINDVAAPFDLSPETLRKEFRRKAHIPLSKYLLLSRVERAKHLLIYTDLKCLEICNEVGFQREDTASGTFKRVAGMNMTSYRSSHKIRLDSNQVPGHDSKGFTNPKDPK